MVYRVDGNQRKIIAALEKMGFTVKNTAMVKHGFPDIVAGIFGLNFLCEIKNPELSPSRRALTFQEKLFFEHWNGNAFILETLDDVQDLYSHALALSKAISNIVSASGSKIDLKGNYKLKKVD